MAERYKIYEQLGAGGVGAVYRAYDNELKRWVAIKRLMTATDASGDKDLVGELRKEADALASLRNPNIVTIFDVASDPEGLFMVMELLEGEDLADVVARGPLHYDDFKELASQSLEALLAAHQRHILHRDIKPENIKVERLPGGRMQSKLIDFGLARAGMRARKQTEDQEGTVMGSIFYMAPEQLTREPVDARTDLYSLGCVFYEALSGRKAFDGDNLHAVIDKHINHDIIPLHVVAPHVPPWLGAWVLRLMAQKPEDRPETAQQAIEEFRAWEKMAAAPPMMPWMPVGYGYTPQGAYTQQIYGAATQPLVPGITTGGVPVHPGYYPHPTGQVPAQEYPQEVYAEPDDYAQPVLEVVPEAEPVVEMAARTSPISRPYHPPANPSQPVGRRSGPTRSTGTTTGKAHFIEEAPPSQTGKWIALIGGSLVVLGAGAWYFFFRAPAKPDTAKGAQPTTAPATSASSLPKVTFTLPEDRVFPPVDGDICLHLVGNVGTRTASNRPVNPNETVEIWHDIAPLGEDNILRVAQKNQLNAPRRINWPAPLTANGVGAKAGRVVLDFRPHADQPIAMVLDDAKDEKDKFPFGNAKIRGQKGLTLGIVIQADESRLPMRVLTLTGDGGSFLAIQVDEKRQVVLNVRSNQGTASITSKDLDATTPCVIVVAWDGTTGDIELRARDAQGTKPFKGTAKAPAPSAPMSRLEVGRVVNASKEPVPPAEQFVGILGELVLYSSLIKPDQIQLFESKVLRDHYIQGPPTTPPPTVKKAQPAPAKAPAPAPAKAK